MERGETTVHRIVDATKSRIGTTKTGLACYIPFLFPKTDLPSIGQAFDES